MHIAGLHGEPEGRGRLDSWEGGGGRSPAPVGPVIPLAVQHRLLSSGDHRLKLTGQLDREIGGKFQHPGAKLLVS